MAEQSLRSSVAVWSDRRRRAAQQIVVGLVLVLLLWGADALARVGAESLLARNIQDATGMADRPEVQVRGVFFLPQVIRGAYSEVDATTTGVTSGPLRIDRVDSTLSDVRVPFHDVLVRDIRTVGIARSDEQATLLYSDLNSYLTATGRPLQLKPGPDGTLQVAGSITVLDRSLDVTSQVKLAVSDGQLSLVPQTIDTGNDTVSEAVRLLVAQRLRLTVPLGTLPFGHDLTAASIGSGGVELTAVGTAIVLQP